MPDTLFFHVREELLYPQSLVISDDEAVLKQAESLGAVTIGVDRTLGLKLKRKADLIVESVDFLEKELIERTFCHSRGIPYKIGEKDSIFLRELGKEDVSTYVNILQEEHIRDCIPDGNMEQSELEERVKSYIQYVYQFYGFGIYGIFLKRNKKMIGAVSLDLKSSTGESEYELGFFVSHYYLKKGYAIMALEILLDFAFHRLEVEKVISITANSNTDAMKLLTRFGFRCEKRKSDTVFILERPNFKKDLRTGEFNE